MRRAAAAAARTLLSLRGVAALLVALHVAKILILFRHVDFSSSMPLVDSDYLLYYVRALRTHAFMEGSGRFWGYDPFQLGGFPAGVFEPGSHWMGLLAHVLAPVLSIGRSLLAMEFLALLLMPFAILPAIGLFGGSRRQSWIGFGLLIPLWGLLEPVSYLGVQKGLLGFQLGCFVGIWVAAASWRLFVRGDRAGFWPLVALAPLLPVIHPLSAIAVAVPCVGFAALGLMRRTPLAVRTLVLVAILSILLNAHWILPVLHFKSWLASAPHFARLDWSRVFGGMFGHFVGYVQFSALAILIAGGFSALRGMAAASSEKFVFFLWFTVLAVLPLSGSVAELFGTFQPVRFLFPLWLIAAVFSAFEFDRVMATGPALRRFVVPATVAAVLAAVAIGAWSGFRLSNSLPLNAERLLSAARRAGGPSNARTMIQVWDGKPFVAALFPYVAGVPTIGGPNPGHVTMARSTVFVGGAVDLKGRERRDSRFGDEALLGMSRESFIEALSLYNVGRILVPEAESAASLSTLVQGKRVSAPVDGWTELTIANSGWTIPTSSAVVSIDFDRIEVRRVPRGVFILKFHWIDTLRSGGGVNLKPIAVRAGFPPFIQIENPTGLERIVIRNEPRLWTR